MGIKIENVFYTYGKKASNSTLALNDVSFAINDNDFVAIVGETGSGKSTLAQCLNALLVPDKGQIVVDDIVVSYKNRKNKKMRDLRKRVGLVFQFPEYQLFEETVEKDVAFGLKNFGMKNDEAIKKAHEALLSVGLNEKYFTKSPFELSGGEKRRVAIAGILAINPDILVLDEPTAGLDLEGARDVMSLVEKMHKDGKTIIVVTHDMELVMRYCDLVFVLKDGKLAYQGSKDELFESIDSSSSIEIPPLYQLAQKLKERGAPINIKDIRSIDDLVEQMKRWRSKDE